MRSAGLVWDLCGNELYQLFSKLLLFLWLSQLMFVDSAAGVYPLFRCNAADLAGPALRVRVSLVPTPAALPRPPCAEECSNSEDEGPGEPPALSQQVSDKQQVVGESSGITSGEAQEDDVVFLENTVAVNILVERAMHLSLKGNITHTPFLFFLSSLSFFFLCFLFLCFPLRSVPTPAKWMAGVDFELGFTVMQPQSLCKYRESRRLNYSAYLNE